MSDAGSTSFPLDDSTGAEGSAGNEREVRWEVVAEMPGLLPARIIADRLQAEGIPANAWQESVGQAYGMVFGPLGTGFVSVPEEFVDAAKAILEAAEEMDIDFDAEEEE